MELTTTKIIKNVFEREFNLKKLRFLSIRNNNKTPSKQHNDDIILPARNGCL